MLLPFMMVWMGFIQCIIVNHFRKLEDGDIVNVDVTVYYKGVHGKKLYTLVWIIQNSFSKKLYHLFYQL